uniref:Uncharacterized protein n=1 Tax=Lotharella oceanica TaxID=641309 RepID=A0A7S2XH00_9EUKA
MNDVIEIQEGHEYAPFAAPAGKVTEAKGIAPGDKRPSVVKNKRACYEKKLQELREKKAEINSYLANQYLNRRLGAADRYQRKKRFKKSTRRNETRRGNDGDEKLHRLSTLSVNNRRYLSRQNTNHSILTSESDLPTMTEFEAFWQKNLRFPAKLAMRCFYVGTTCLLFAISFLIFARFTLTLRSDVGAYTFVVFVAISLLLGSIVACLPSPKIHTPEDHENLVPVRSPGPPAGAVSRQPTADLKINVHHQHAG